MRVFRNNCQSFQKGLVLYPDAPAPVNGSKNITISCVPNATIFGMYIKSHVIVMEHGVLRILCVNASLDMKIEGQSALVSL